MKKLILIDGSSILSTSFYANLPKDFYGASEEQQKKMLRTEIMRTSKGIPTNAVYTFIKILLKILEKQKPTHLAVAWDLTRNTFRRELYKDYKGQRKETFTELKEQFKLTQQILKDINIASFGIEKFEADDIIGTLSKTFNKEIPTFIFTKDQDALQLVDENTRLWLITSKFEEMYKSIGINDIKSLNLPNGVFEFTPLFVKEFYDLEPLQIIDKKALEGDKSDNIPGVKGVGPKAAIPLLQEYETIENIYDNIENLSKEEEKELKEFFKELGIKRSPLNNLLKGKDLAFLSKKLATINTEIEDIKDKVKLENLSINIKVDKFKEIIKELEFKSINIEKII